VGKPEQDEDINVDQARDPEAALCHRRRCATVDKYLRAVDAPQAAAAGDLRLSGQGAAAQRTTLILGTHPLSQDSAYGLYLAAVWAGAIFEYTQMPTLKV
jgi:hypothetical protein